MYNKVCVINATFFFHFSFLASMRTKNIVNRLSLFLGSQPICIVGFGFPTMGSLLPGDPVAHSCFCRPLSLSL